MRLLLTSGGLTTKTLRNAFCSLLGKDVTQSRVAFIPTAANACTDISWLESDINNLRITGIGAIDFVDLSKLPGTESVERCRAADAIWLNGGNTFYLLDWVRNSGLATELIVLLQSRLYIGVSAGSMITGPSIESNSAIFPEEDSHKVSNLDGLNLVPFAIIPHLFSPHFPNSRPQQIEKFASQVQYPIYALDDASAIEVTSDGMKIISEGVTCSYNLASFKN